MIYAAFRGKNEYSSDKIEKKKIFVIGTVADPKCNVVHWILKVCPYLLLLPIAKHLILPNSASTSNST